jgi:hypothetical protein
MAVPSDMLSGAIGEDFWEDSPSPPSMFAPPVIARLAGLPAQALESLTSLPCIVLLQARQPLEDELGETRRSMVQAISDALPGFDAGTRRFLLAVKRSCFNGREIEAWRRKAGWAELLRVSPNLAERILILEEQLRENDRDFTAIHEHELTRERRHILDLVQDHRFLRGIALGRPGLVQQVRAQAVFLTALEFPKRPRKWEQSILRFVTRSAAKLSANSTLTAYALGSIQSSPAPFRFVGSPQREVSLVRINRPELEQFQTLLIRLPALRGHALVAWNDSVQEIEPGQYRYVRDGYWNLDPGAECFNFVQPARITVRLSRVLLGAARDALGEGILRYDTLLALLADGHGGPRGETPTPIDRSDLDQLVELGILILMPPWPNHEPWLEQRIGQFLRALPSDPTVQVIADALDELLALEKGFAAAPRPEDSVTSMVNAFSRLLDTVAYLAGHEGPLAIRANFYEDVLFEPAINSSDTQRIFQIAMPVVQDILHSANLVLRFAALFNHRHDILHTLASWWKEHEPNRREIPFIEIAQRFAPIWKEFLHFHKTASQSILNTFNPLHVSEIEMLKERRSTLLFQSKELLRTSLTEDVLPVPQFEELLETIPLRYSPLLGASVFVQPVNARDCTWVLNRFYEGTGRYLTRVTPILEGATRQQFLDHLIARSVIAIDGEEADLLEVKHPWGNLVNAHPPQMEKVLDIRGLYLDLPPKRRVSLGEITITADLNSETFRLIDVSGRRVLPVCLSSLGVSGLPNLVHFFLIFGPGENRGVFPFSNSQGDEGLRSFNRLICGKLILRRRSWKIDIESLRTDLEGLNDAKAYVCVYKWRRRRGLPAAGFYSERTFRGAIKPQYIDFSSPSLCSLFVSSLRKMATAYLNFEEALPPYGDFPFDSSMNRRGVELLIDSLALRTMSGTSSA